MDAKNLDQANIELKEKILESAMERFMSYGYGKTTMAEIAKDLSMSAANLYRYFENKQEIGTACAEQCIGNRLERLKNVIRDDQTSAAECLRLFVIEGFRHNLEIVEERPKINELVESMSSECNDIVYWKIEKQVSLISEILARGNQNGEFDVDDVVGTARSVFAALILFDVPIFARLFPPTEFEELATNVVALLVSGLKKN